MTHICFLRDLTLTSHSWSFLDITHLETALQSKKTPIALTYLSLHHLLQNERSKTLLLHAVDCLTFLFSGLSLGFQVIIGCRDYNNNAKAGECTITHLWASYSWWIQCSLAQQEATNASDPHTRN